MVELEKKYERPENCNPLKGPRVKKKDIGCYEKQAHLDDLNLQVIKNLSQLV